MGRDFPPVQTGPGAHPASCTMGTGSFPGVKYGRGVLLTTHPLLVPWSWKSRAIPLPTLWATTRPVTGTLVWNTRLLLVLSLRMRQTVLLLPTTTRMPLCCAEELTCNLLYFNLCAVQRNNFTCNLLYFNILPVHVVYNLRHCKI